MSGNLSHRPGRRRHVVAALVMLLAPPAAGAGQSACGSACSDETGLRVVHALRTATPIRVDGHLDEDVWGRGPGLSGFVQHEPQHGEPAVYDTRLRVLYDDDNLYIGAFLYDPEGAAAVRAPDMRRDFDAEQHDVLTIVLDPFRDGRNSLVLQVNARGALRDMQVRDGTIENSDWDAVWTARTMAADSGWSVELAVPWRTLRYPAGSTTWSFNVTRLVRRTGELSGWAAWPRGYRPYHGEYMGQLGGLETPVPARNLQVQPYVVTRDERVDGASQYDGSDRVRIGGDAKWAVTPNTVLDLTLNTDFAQTDVDEQVVNLNRYSVFFPEKRGFFLEASNTYRVGYNLFTPFYTRRIGLSGGVPVPLDGGARVTSAGVSRQFGALLVRQRGTESQPAAHFGVVRGSLNAGAAGGRVGGMLVVRHDEASDVVGERRNVVGVVDGYTRFGSTGAVTAFVSGSANGGSAAGTGFASYLWVRTNSSRGYLGFLQDIATRDYDAAAGFIFRRDIILNSPAGELDWRPAWRPSYVRSFRPGFSNYTYHRLSDGAFLQADLRVDPIDINMHNGGNIRVAAGPTWQRLDEAEAAIFRPLGARMAAGGYRYGVIAVEARTDASRAIGTSASVTTGGYYDGRLTTSRAALRVAPSAHLAVRGSIEHNAASSLGIDDVDVTSRLTLLELRGSLDPRVHLTVTHQHNSLSGLGAWNARLSWEFRPLSFLHVVWNDSRIEPDLRTPGQTAVTGRQFIIKLSWLGQL
jgi:hypothetical protein